MKTLRYAPLVLLLVLPAAGCISVMGVQPNLLTTEEEVKIGNQVAGEVEQKEEVLNNAQVQAYVAGIGAKLAALAPRQDVAYEFKVIDSPDTVNAFALPGGKMYVYTGLMKLCRNEAELASVMAHEIAHVACYHHGEALTRQYLMSAVAGLALGENPEMVAEIAASLIGGGFTAYYSRDNEREADQVGMTILYQAGYRPDAMVTFMQKMLEEEARSGGGHPLPIFSSHPPTQERMDYLTQMVGQYPYDVRLQRPIYVERYQQQALSRLK